MVPSHCLFGSPIYLNDSYYTPIILLAICTPCAPWRNGESIKIRLTAQETTQLLGGLLPPLLSTAQLLLYSLSVHTAPGPVTLVERRRCFSFSCSQALGLGDASGHPGGGQAHSTAPRMEGKTWEGHGTALSSLCLSKSGPAGLRS